MMAPPPPSKQHVELLVAFPARHLAALVPPLDLWQWTTEEWHTAPGCGGGTHHVGRLFKLLIQYLELVRFFARSSDSRRVRGLNWGSLRCL